MASHIVLYVIKPHSLFIRDCLQEAALCVNRELHKMDSQCTCGEKNRETGALQGEATAVWLIELKSDTVQQLRRPLRVIRPLTLLINAPHLPLFSKSLQSRVLTIKIYHMVSNNIISTRKRSEALLCGLAKVEFIRTHTQVGTMIAADNFKSTEIEPQGPAETSTSSSAHPRIETFVNGAVAAAHKCARAFLSLTA